MEKGAKSAPSEYWDRLINLSISTACPTFTPAGASPAEAYPTIAPEDANPAGACPTDANPAEAYPTLKGQSQLFAHFRS